MTTAADAAAASDQLRFSLSLSRSTQSILSAVIPFRSPTSIPAVSTMACYWCYCFPWLLPTNTKINANWTAAVIWKQATLQGADVSIGNYAVSPPEKRPPFCFLNNSVKKLTDLMIFGTLNPEIIWREILQVCPTHLSDVAILPWKIQKKSLSTVLFIPSEWDYDSNLEMGMLRSGNKRIWKWIWPLFPWEKFPRFFPVADLH